MRFTFIKKLVITTFLLVVPMASWATTDLFLRIDEAPGESTDPTHAKEIELLSWSWGLNRSSSLGSVANFQDMVVTKYSDSSTPIFMLAAANGQHFMRGTLFIRDHKTGVEYMRIEIEKIAVTNVTIGGSHRDARISENVTLHFSRIAVIYVPTNSNGGQIEFRWDLEANAPA